MVNKSYKIVKYIFYILCIISLFFTIKNKVYAMGNVVSAPLFSNQTTLGIAQGDYSATFNINGTNGVFENYGHGEVLFSYQTESINNITSQIKSIEIKGSHNVYFPCDIGTTTTYYDSNSLQIVGTARCPVFVNGFKISSIRFTRGGTGGATAIRLSPTISFVEYPNDINVSVDNTSIINAISDNINGLLRELRADNIAIRQSNEEITQQLITQQQQQHQDSQATQQKITDINNTIKDSNVDTSNANNTFSGLNNSMASNNTISNLLLMPIRLLQKLLNAFNGTCSAINTGRVFDTDFVLPCIDIESIIGSALWNLIDVVGAGALAYAIGKKMVKIFNQFTNLKEGGLESAYD